MDPACTAPASLIVDAAPVTTLAAVFAASTAGFPVVRLDAEAVDAVVLAHSDRVAELLLDGDIASPADRPLDTAATLITDPGRQAALLRRAARALLGQARTAEFDLECRNHEHELKLRQIRDYAIARHRDDDICRDGLDTFLAHFGLQAYEPRIRVRFTITGSYLVRGGSASAARSDGHYLRLDTTTVDDVIEDSEDFHVDIDSAEELDDE